MSASEQGIFELGENVTSRAKSKSQRGTAVLSVRLPVSELTELEIFANASGKIPSQIAREAIREFLQSPRYAQPTVTISLEGGMSMSTGAAQVVARAASAETLPLQQLVRP